MAQRMGNETCSLPSSPSVAQIISNKKLLLALGEHFSQVVYWPKRGFAHPQTYWQTKFHMTSPSRTGGARWCVRVKAEGVAFLPHVPITTHSNSTAIFWTWFSLPFFLRLSEQMKCFESCGVTTESESVNQAPPGEFPASCLMVAPREQRGAPHKPIHRWVHGTGVFCTE